jgi:hypothetical protein
MQITRIFSESLRIVLEGMQRRIYDISNDRVQLSHFRVGKVLAVEVFHGVPNRYGNNQCRLSGVICQFRFTC